MSMQMPLKVALVTGAGTGVGKAAVAALLGAGFQVALTGRREEALTAAAATLDPDGTSTLVLPGDVSQPADVERVFGAIRDRYGRLDVLFNNAGVGAPGIPLEDLSFDQWKTVVDINLTGVFLCIQQAFKIMKAQSPRGGRIINNGSISAYVPRPNSAPYTATKHAVTGLTRTASLDGRKYDIACGQIDIGNADTEMAQKQKDGVLQANGSIAVEPTMSPDDVGRAVAFMATLPLDTNVQFMTVMATAMPFVGRG
ncbi:SDR family oxidoreductase [Lichenihabitans psoromatis]|uniref:SDR family oxidoreductase n=1 Tax=Lichenihabitans psoromatis TaxID=2528642 RepID=UPI001FDEB949|nr:SDR family oxidoreductase [Lichenihabitans psoromatis]